MGSKNEKQGMKIIIIGAGNVGSTLVEQLAHEGHDITIIDIVARKIQAITDNYDVMGLVGNAWGAFGAAFGPTILLSLYWKRFNYAGAISGIITGFAVDITWGVLRGAMVLAEEDVVIKGTLGGLYEIIPGFFVSLLVCIIVSKCTAKPSAEVEALFDEGVAMTRRDDEETAEA